VPEFAEIRIAGDQRSLVFDRQRRRKAIRVVELVAGLYIGGVTCSLRRDVHQLDRQRSDGVHGGNSLLATEFAENQPIHFSVVHSRHEDLSAHPPRFFLCIPEIRYASP